MLGGGRNSTLGRGGIPVPPPEPDDYAERLPQNRASAPVFPVIQGIFQWMPIPVSSVTINPERVIMSHENEDGPHAAHSRTESWSDSIRMQEVITLAGSIVREGGHPCPPVLQGNTPGLPRSIIFSSLYLAGYHQTVITWVYATSS